MADRFTRAQAIRHLLCEAAGGPNAGSRAIAGAAVDTLTRVAAELAKLIGQGGVSALYTRSLHVTRSTFPWLAALEGPTRVDAPFADLKASLELRLPAEAIDASSAFLTVLTELLVTLIGEELTARIVRSAWDDFGTTQQEAGI